MNSEDFFLEGDETEEFMHRLATEHPKKDTRTRTLEFFKWLTEKTESKPVTESSRIVVKCPTCDGPAFYLWGRNSRQWYIGPAECGHPGQFKDVPQLLPPPDKKVGF